MSIHGVNEVASLSTATEKKKARNRVLLSLPNMPPTLFSAWQLECSLCVCMVKYAKSKT